jgi:ABC-type uncharacterized transport system substrate-binding protein
MRRREFIILLGGTAAAWPLLAHAQQTVGKVYKIGYLQTSTRVQQLHLIKAFEDGLRALGYRVGDNLIIEYRFAEANLERLPELAAELVRLDVDIIVTGLNANTAAALKATTTIPIVMANSVDPVGAGLIANLAQPGGNVTGMTQDAGDEIYGKRLELLKEAVPNISRVVILFNPDFTPNLDRLASIRKWTQALGLTLVSIEARHGDAIVRGFGSVAKTHTDALVVLSDPVLFNYRSLIGAMALANHLPAVAVGREYAETGLLLSYGVDQRDLWRRAAVFVDKIIKGAKPADLPVEQPTKFEFVINLNTAKALSLAVPPSLLSRADEVIE